MENKIKIADLFVSLQKQMVAQLNTNREHIHHATSKGDSLENVWIEWLRKYLPNRYCVDKAIIVDCDGNLSQQIDLVIYDQHHTPFVFTQNGIHYIPAEGVYAVFEVKPEFDGTSDGKSYIQYAGEKIESVRKLKRTSVGIINAGRRTTPRGLTKIVGGILASANGFKKNETLEKHLKSLTGLQTMEMGCAVDFGSFCIDYKGAEDENEKDLEKRFRRYYNERSINKITFSNADNSMVTFFLQLTHYLQQVVGTVAAIDLNAYAKAVGYTIDENI